MKILHTADIHIGYETHGRLNAKTGLNSRLLDFRKCFEFMVERALAEDIDLFLFAGDAYRTADPTPTQKTIFAECLRPILDANIPVVMIVGNHDHPVSFGKSSSIDIFAQLSDLVTVVRRPDLLKIETKSGIAQIIAMPWPIRSLILSKDEHRKKSPAEVRELIEKKYTEYLTHIVTHTNPEQPVLMAGHFSVVGATFGGSERMNQIDHEPKFLASQLALPEIDYVALGHIHRHQDLNAGGSPSVVYSSSIERISFKEAKDPRGFVIVDVDTIDTDKGKSEKKTTWKFVETPARTFIDIQVDATEAEHPTEMIVNAIKKHDITDAIVRVRYRIDESQISTLDLYAIRDVLKPAHSIAALDRKISSLIRERRTSVTREASLQDALSRYIDQHEHLEKLKPKLMATAAELENRIESS